MFCLRTWIPVLFFISNVSPLYLLLFVSATYYLNRPCLYCSLLLTVLVISIYDFHNNWFEPQIRGLSFGGAEPNATHADTLQHVTVRGASMAASLANSTVGTLAQSAVEGLKRKIGGDAQTQSGSMEWLKDVLSKKEWRIPCIDVAVRF